MVGKTEATEAFQDGYASGLRNGRKEGVATAPAPRDTVKEDREQKAWLADLDTMLGIVGLGTHARPCSAHDVIQNELIPRLEEMRDAMGWTPLPPEEKQ